MREKLSVAAVIIGFLSALFTLFFLGDYIRDEWLGGVPLGWAHTFLYYATAALLIGSGYGLFKYKWRNGGKDRLIICACWCGIVLGLVLNRVITDPDSNCYVDWDGRSNPTVCE